MQRAIQREETAQAVLERLRLGRESPGNRPPVATSAGSRALAELREARWREILSPDPQHWTEVLGYQLFEYEGSPDGDHGSRRIRQIVDLRPLVVPQKPAGIPTAYRHALVAMWDERRANVGALEVAHSYLKSPTGSLYIFGGVGTGKTWVACAIANELLQEGRPVQFKSAGLLLLELRDTFGAEGATELNVLTPLFETDYLVLDDLGDTSLARECQATNFATSRFLTLLDHRWQAGKVTIITSNLNLRELVEWCTDERIGSRIRGLCGESGIIELPGRDLRFDSESSPVPEHAEAVAAL